MVATLGTTDEPITRSTSYPFISRGSIAKGANNPLTSLKMVWQMRIQAGPSSCAQSLKPGLSRFKNQAYDMKHAWPIVKKTNQRPAWNAVNRNICRPYCPSCMRAAANSLGFTMPRGW